MFKTQVEPRDTGKGFHCFVLDILWPHFYGLKECRPWKHMGLIIGISPLRATCKQKPVVKVKSEEPSGPSGWSLSQVL